MIDDEGTRPVVLIRQGGRNRRLGNVFQSVAAVLALCWAGMASAPASGSDVDAVPGSEHGLVQAMDDAIAVLADPDTLIGVWLGPEAGTAWYRRDADRVFPAASAIKTALLIEFLAMEIDALDAPFAPLDEILDDPVVIGHFNAQQQADARRELRGLSTRQLAEAMVHKEHVTTNAAYNAAANVVIHHLGGPAAATARIHDRFPDARDLRVGRYMLAQRTPENDNLLSGYSLAVPLRYLAGPSSTEDALREAARSVLWLESDPARGEHFYKGGSLRSAPQVRIEAGWWEGDGVAAVYVVIASRPADSEWDYDSLRDGLRDLSALVQEAGVAMRGPD